MCVCVFIPFVRGEGLETERESLEKERKRERVEIGMGEL